MRQGDVTDAFIGKILKSFKFSFQRTAVFHTVSDTDFFVKGTFINILRRSNKIKKAIVFFDNGIHKINHLIGGIKSYAVGFIDCWDVNSKEGHVQSAFKCSRQVKVDAGSSGDILK